MSNGNPYPEPPRRRSPLHTALPFALGAVALCLAACSEPAPGSMSDPASAGSGPDTAGVVPGTGTDGPDTVIDPDTGLPVPVTGPDPGPGQAPATGSNTPGGPNVPGSLPVNQGPTTAPSEVITRNGTAVDCTTVQRPPTPLRRLTRYEYNNTVRDLFGTASRPADAFPPDEEVTDGFSNNALVLTVSALHAEKYVEAAESLASEAITRLDTLLNCDTATLGEEACARQFAEDFGRRAYRRPLEQGDVDTLMEAYALGDSFSKGMELMLRTILQSPHFLYRVEFTGTETPGAGMVRLNGYETATRLSYLLWGSAPDAALLDAARDGALDTPEQVATKAREMLTDARAPQAIAEFVRQWLGLTKAKLDNLTKDATTYPRWSVDLPAAMQAETDAFVEHVLWQGDASLTTLLTESSGLPTGPLADLYGVPASDSVVALPPEQERAGLLTLPGFLAKAAHPDQTSPVLRGKFVRSKMLCDPPPPPPPEANITPPDPQEGGTARERFTNHLSDTSCQGCHLLMDPLGFTFENFDAMGIHRTTDEGRELDLSGEIFASKDADGPFNGVRELATKLAASQQVKDCVAAQWFRFSMGRTDEDGDVCSVTPLQQHFEASGANLMELLVSMTQTEAFLFRRAVSPEEVTP